MVKLGASFALFVTLFVASTNCQKMKRRMMNGIEKEIQYLPWVVAFCTEEFSVTGTGSILSEKWVLTAAHLWSEAESEDYRTDTKDNTIIKYGATVIDATDGAVARIDDIFVHPSFIDPAVGQKQQYDAAMVRVVDTLMLRPGFAEAKPLADDSDTFAPGRVCVLAGFGDTGDPVTSAQPHHLSFLPMPIIKRDLCKQTLNPLPRNLFCAGLLSVAATGCFGDSGAPLTCGGRVYGIYVLGGPCLPGVVTANIFVYVKTVSPFIREVMEKE